MSKSKYVGVDGCPYGWFSVGFDDYDHYELEIFEHFEEVVAHYSQARRILVDMPIGLPCPGPEPRHCDTEARKKLGSPRSSSVFRVPIREAIYMVQGGASREKADKRSRHLNSRGVGVQAFNIMKKVAEVDKALVARDKNASPEVREIHPEVCFWSLNGNRAMRDRKKLAAGIDERINVLVCLEPQVEAIYQSALSKYLRKTVARDDILDALVAAVTAKLSYQDGYELKTLPECPPMDSKGLRIEMVYVEPATGTP